MRDSLSSGRGVFRVCSLGYSFTVAPGFQTIICMLFHELFLYRYDVLNDVRIDPYHYAQRTAGIFISLRDLEVVTLSQVSHKSISHPFHSLPHHLILPLIQ